MRFLPVPDQVALKLVGLESFKDKSLSISRSRLKIPGRYLIKELLSLVDYSQVNPILPLGYPFDPSQEFGWYWTSTTFLAQPDFAWSIFMSNAVVQVLDIDVPGVMVYVWPISDP